MKELKEAQMGIITILALMLVSIKRRLPATRRLSSGITTLALAGFVLLVAAGGASANGVCVWGNIGAGAYYECGDLVTQSCTLNASMDCSDETLNGLIIGADGITIDGAGYSMTGDLVNATCTASQTSPCVTHSGVINIGGWDNVVVKDLEITNFCTGVVIGTAGETDTEENMTVTGCNIHNCGNSVRVTHGIHLVGANYCTITKNEIHNIEGQGIDGGCGGGGNGIFMHGDTAQMTGIYGDYNNITCNYLHHNKKSGFFMKFQCMYCNISYNKATDNTQSGIMPKCEMSNHNTIEYNNMSDNGANGFYCGGDNNTVRHNTALNNGAAGIEFKSSADHNTAEHNFVCGHTTDILLGDPDNSGDENTCDTGPSGWCDWSCGNEVAVYYDFDKDDQCSKKWDDCQCALPGTGSKCACCNPGLFDGSSAATTAYENSCNRDCQWTPGPDPNDCDFDITGIIKPDLIVVDKSEAWFNETYYNVSYRVRNIGNATSNESGACVYINTVHQAGYDETIGELAQGAYSPVKTVGPFGPCGSPSDTIKVCADCDNNNTEWNESNNCLENEWFGNQPDLIIVNKSETWFDQGAGIYNITYRVKNIGTATTTHPQGSRTRVSIDGTPTGIPGVVPILAPGEEFIQTLPYGITMSDSSDTIELTADGPNWIVESDENNNTITNVFSSAPKISVDVPSSCVDGEFCVNIIVDPNGQPVYGVQYKLTYNASVIYVLSQDEGTFLSHNGNNTAETNNHLDTVNGYSTYGLTRIDSLLGETTPGTLVKVKYKTIGSPEATSWINLSEVVVSDNNADPLDSTLENRSVSICPENQPPDANCSVDHKYNNAGYGMTTFNGTESTDDANLLNHFFTWQTHTHTGNLLGMVVDDFYDVSCYKSAAGGYDPFSETMRLTDSGGLMDTCTCDVIVYIAGDANGDCKVNVLDASMTGLRWGADAKDEVNYPGVCWGMTLPTGNIPGPMADMADRADLNNDEDVNVLDTSIVGLNWGNTCQGTC